jgi:signal transduction histidine kinase
MTTPRKALKEFRALKISLSLKFIIGTAIVLTLVMGISIHFISYKNKGLIIEQLNIQAKTLFSQIILTRRWIADHGGIFVEKFPWKNASPYLTESEIVDIKGKKYLKENSAMVTKELSSYARDEGMYWFNITSLTLTNPENTPDLFEREALISFEKGGVKELSRIEKIGGANFYRYIAPLYVEESCLTCHAQQGYSLGDVRGAISVSLPMDYAMAMLDSEKKTLIIASFAMISLLMIVLFIMMKELVLRPVQELKSSIEDFSTGHNSKTSIIRTGDELQDLSSSFIEMSRSLKEYHTNLENRVHLATRSLEEANVQLAELNENKSDFIAKISHELRTPMTSIKGAMDYLSTRLPMISGCDEDTGDLIEFLDVIRKNADRLIRMVNDTLDLEHIESGMFDLHLNQVDIIALIKEVILIFQSMATERNITFRILAGPEIIISADEDRIRQVLINLVSNAMNYSPDNAEIQFKAAVSDNTVTITLSDEGPGIPDEVRGKIFDKFYTIGKRHGTGLGLAICRGIIEAHHGEIKASSNNGNKGSSIYFALPVLHKEVLHE